MLCPQGVFPAPAGRAGSSLCPPPPTGELPRGWEPASKTQDDALERSNVPENEVESKAGVTSVPWHGLNHFLVSVLVRAQLSPVPPVHTGG